MRDRPTDGTCEGGVPGHGRGGQEGAGFHRTARETADVLELLQGAMTLAIPSGLSLEALIERCERPG